MCEVHQVLDKLYWLCRDRVTGNGPESTAFAQSALMVKREEMRHFQSCPECQRNERRLHSMSPAGVFGQDTTDGWGF